MSTLYKEFHDINQSSKTKLALIFYGDISDCYVLWYLLSKTNLEIVVYTPFIANDYNNLTHDLKKIIERNNEILNNFQKELRIFKHIKSKTIRYHTEPQKQTPEIILLDYIALKEQKDDFEYCIILSDEKYFSHPIETANFHHIINTKSKSLKILTPLAQLDTNRIILDSLRSGLNYYHINIHRLFNKNYSFFKTMTLFMANKITLDHFKKHAPIHTENLGEPLIYLALECQWEGLEALIRVYQNKLPKQLVLRLLGYMGIFIPYKQELISLCLSGIKATKEDINEIGTGVVHQLIHPDYNINKLFTFAAKSKVDSLSEANDSNTISLLISEHFFINADFFMRSYGFDKNNLFDIAALNIIDAIANKDIHSKKLQHKSINDLKVFTEVELTQYTKQVHAHYLCLMLDRLIHQGADTAELIITKIKNATSQTDIVIEYLLSEYGDTLEPLQLNEILLESYINKRFELCDKLIHLGADPQVIKFHYKGYALNHITSLAKKICSNWRGYDSTLIKDNFIIKEVLDLLGNPEKKIPPVFHVTGSNGKGSVCTMIRSILEYNGYRVHSFMSPSLIRSNEIYIISSDEIPESVFHTYLERATQAFNAFYHSEALPKLLKKLGISEEQHQKEGFHPWNIVFPALLLAFSEEPADATVIEVVVGGELDITNVFDSQSTAATVVNSIYQNDNHDDPGLFKTIEDRASTKSRLCKQDVPLICAEQELSVINVIKEETDKKGAPLLISGHDFIAKKYDENTFTYTGFERILSLKKPRLVGDYQINNAALSLSAILSAGKLFNLTEENISQGIYNAEQMGRMAYVSDNPKFQYLHSIFRNSTPSVYCGSVKDSKGLVSFLSEMEQTHGNKRFAFVVNLPSISQRVISGVETIDQFNFNIQSLSIYNTLDIEDNFVLEHHTEVLSQGILSIKRSLSGALLCHDFTKIDILCIISFGLEILPKQLICLLQRINQTNYHADLEYAKRFSEEDTYIKYLLEREK